MACIRGMARMSLLFSAITGAVCTCAAPAAMFGTGLWEAGSDGHGKRSGVLQRGTADTEQMCWILEDGRCVAVHGGCVVTVGVAGKGLDVVVVVVRPGGPQCSLEEGISSRGGGALNFRHTYIKQEEEEGFLMACPGASRREHGGGSGARGPVSLGRTLAMQRDVQFLARTAT